MDKSVVPAPICNELMLDILEFLYYGHIKVKVDHHLENLLEKIQQKLYQRRHAQRSGTRYVRYRTRYGAPSVNRRSFTEEELIRFAEENDGFPMPSTEAEIRAFDKDVFLDYNPVDHNKRDLAKPRSRSIPELYHDLNAKLPKFTAPNKPKFLDRLITGVRQKTKTKQRKTSVSEQNGESDQVDGAQAESWGSQSEVSNSDFYLSVEGSSINLDNGTDDGKDSDSEAYQTATGSLNSPSKSSKVWSTPSSPVISGLVQKRCLDYCKLTESDASPEIVRKGSVKLTAQSTPTSPSGSKAFCAKQHEAVHRTENWLKSYFSQSRDKKFSDSVMSKGYVKALVEKINDLHQEITPDSTEKLLTLHSDDVCVNEGAVGESKESVQTNLSESRSDVDLKSLEVKLNNDRMFKSFHREGTSSRKNSVDSNCETEKSNKGKKHKPPHIDIKDNASKAILQNPACQQMSPAELFDQSWSDSDSSFDEMSDDSEADETLPSTPEVVPERQEPVCEIQPTDKLRCIAEELYKTEKSYVDRLNLLHEIFMKKVVDDNSAQPFMTPDAINQMFSNLGPIYKFHNDFLLPGLESRINKWEKNPRIGDLMKQNAPFLKLYTDYVKNFDNAMNLMNYWQEKSTKFSSIVRDVQKLPECGNLTLQHHMLGPIQRVPRYELLLKDYIKKLPEGSPDLEDAQNALELVTKAASHSNEAMSKIEKFRKLLEIHQSLRGMNVDFISPTRALVREGLITKIAARSGEKQTRYLFLFNDLLLICSPLLGAYRVRAQMDIDNMETKEGDNLNIAHTFTLMSKQKTIELLDEQTAEGEEKWYETLVKTIEEYREKKKRIREKQQLLTNMESGIGRIGERAPRWIPDESATICMRCEVTFSTFRRRHHCRGCGWVICNKCCKKAPLEYKDNKYERVCQKCYNIIIKQSTDEGYLDDQKKDVLQVQAKAPCVLSAYLNNSGDKGKTWMKRWFAVHEDFVLYSFRTDQDTGALKSYPLPGFSVEAVKNIHNKPYVFKLFHKDKKVYYFETDDAEQLVKWISVLKKITNLELPDDSQRHSAQSASSSGSSSGANSSCTNNNNNSINDTRSGSGEITKVPSDSQSKTEESERRTSIC